ncbi:ATP-dependent DNA helicase, partial [Candidatus Woesearchaeota archaeon]|nr:ATP-dependent DNA helicase [Candidatus Woesearchaeota archaeon]
NKVHEKKALTVEAKLALKELEHSSPMHNEEVITLAKEKSMCSYELSMALAKKAQVIIGDYYYLFNPFVQNTFLNKLQLEMDKIILIVDEGHNLPNRITEMLSSYLTTNMLRNGIIEAKKFNYNGVIQWLDALNHILLELKDAEFSTALTMSKSIPQKSFSKPQERLVSKGEFMEKVKLIIDYNTLVTELEIAADEVRKKQQRSYLGGIATFLAQWKGEDHGYVRIISEKESKYGPIISLNYSCLDPGIVAKDIFKSIAGGVIMSGTLNPTFMYKDVLGIEKGVEKEYTSPFPPENKLTLVVPETTTKFTLRGETMYQKIADKCSEIIKVIPGNTALFFPSYFVRDNVGKFIKSDKKMFWEKSEMSKEEKEGFLESFRQEKNKGGLLLGVTGANFAEGVDLPGNLLNGVIVIGLPLSKPDLKTNALIKYYEQKFGRGWDYGYTYPAMSKCIQSAGRCIRSETDKGVIVYLDERFAWQRYYQCLPEKVGLRVMKDVKEIIESFFATSTCL